MNHLRRDPSIPAAAARWNSEARAARPVGTLWHFTGIGHFTTPYAVASGAIATIHPTGEPLGSTWDVVLRNMFGEVLAEYRDLASAADAYDTGNTILQALHYSSTHGPDPKGNDDIMSPQPKSWHEYRDAPPEPVTTKIIKVQTSIDVSDVTAAILHRFIHLGYHIQYAANQAEGYTLRIGVDETRGLPEVMVDIRRESGDFDRVMIFDAPDRFPANALGPRDCAEALDRFLMLETRKRGDSVTREGSCPECESSDYGPLDIGAPYSAFGDRDRPERVDVCLDCGHVHAFART